MDVLKKAFYFVLTVMLVLITAQAKLYIANMDVATFSQDEGGYLAIVIDDFGYGGEGTESMLELDIPFSAALMPFSKRSKEDLELIKNAGKEYIVHLPMESLTGKREWVGDKGIFTDMTEKEIKEVTEEALDIVKGATGVNNHMGSAVTTDEKSLSAVFDVLKEKGVFFIDSVTVSDTVSGKVGADKGVTVLKRDVFLDSTDDIEKIKNNILKAGEVALNNKTAIAIGHVGPEGGEVTAKALKEMAPVLEKMGVKLVTVSKLKEIRDL